MSHDLIVINPSAAHGIFGEHPIYGDLGDKLTAIEPPMWARLLAGYAADRGYEVEIIDAEALRLSPAETASRVMAAQPRLVCIAVYGHMPSASTQQMVAAGETAKEIKKVSDAPIIMVGGHPSALPERTLREEAVDFVGVGEGPITVIELLRLSQVGGRRKYYDGLPGLIWRNDLSSTGITRNPPAPSIEDLRQLHGHAWNLLPMEKYRAHDWQCLSDLSARQPYASIYTSLNCPYGCSFCCISAPFGNRKYKTRDPQDVVDEIEYLHEEHGVSTIKITDEMFVLRPNHYLAVCQGIIDRGLGDGLNIWSYARVDTVKPDNLSLLRRAGVRWLALGIESASKHVRDGAEKKFRTEDIVGVVKKVQSAGINVIGNFMVGLRDDSLETMQRTFDLAIESMPDWSNWYSTMAYPGSGLYDQAIRDGWRLPPNWRSFSQHNDSSFPLDTEHVDNRTVLAFRDQAFNDFFSHPSYLTHVKSKFGSEALAHVQRMLTYKLKRKLLESAA